MKLIITKADWDNVTAAIAAGGKIWENDLLKDFKRKIKDYNRYLQGEQCCYCRKNFGDEFNMVIDIEHVLPKGQFTQFMFQFFNLSVACKRCNMEIKNEDVSFITDINAIQKKPQDTNLYKIIHPNLDNYFNHISYNVKIVNEKTIIKYKIIKDGAKKESEKGKFTYEYFQLADIEKESYNQAQGIKVAEKLSNKINPTIAKKIEKLLSKKKV